MKTHAEFPGRYDQIVHVCRFITENASNVGFAEDDLFRIQLACDEACTNIIEHAYGGENNGTISATVDARRDRVLIWLHDHGRAFTPAKVVVRQPPLALESESDLDKLQRGGLGLHFMRQIMDEIQFEFDSYKGNTLRMVKYL